MSPGRLEVTSLFILRSRAGRAIDAAADEVRRSSITDIAGQEVVYMEKRVEALRYVADHAANPSIAVPGPHIAAESAETGLSPLVVANVVLANATQWLSVKSPAIEAKRVGGKARVRDAATAEDVEAEKDLAIASILALV
jgi:hypothetical protein